MQRPGSRALVPPAMRPLAALLLAACVGVTAILGTLFAHHRRAGALDAAVDARVRAGIGQHPALLSQVAQLGDWTIITSLAAVLILACLVTRWWRGAVLVAVAVPAAHTITEHVVKPLVGRTLPSGGLSFPSGHETRIFTVAAITALFVVGPLRPSAPVAARLLLAIAVLIAAVAVAVAMIGEGAHYFTDTLGGAAVGTAVVTATALILDWLAPVLWQRWRRLGATPRGLSASTPAR
jgi:membrane-associated phospholipid phosphatase